MWPQLCSLHTYWCFFFGWLITCLPVCTSLYLSLCLTSVCAVICACISLCCPPTFQHLSLLYRSHTNSSPVILTSLLSPCTSVPFVLAFLFLSPALNLNSAVFLTSHHFVFPPLSQTLYHLTLCSPSMTPGCPWWITWTSKPLWTWRWQILYVMVSNISCSSRD